MKEYNKIDFLYVRDEKTKRLLPGVYLNKAAEFLKDCKWEFTEKIDGTNIRVHWDGYRVSFAGRTDNASIPPRLLAYLQETFGGEVNEQIFEQHFGDKEVTLYGEGYGAKIQKGDSYRPDNAFILFDAMIGDVFLKRDSLCDIAEYFGIEVVPVVLRGTISDGIDFVLSKPDSTIGTAKMEGVVGKPLVDLYDRLGQRVVVKIKVRDMEEIARYGN